MILIKASSFCILVSLFCFVSYANAENNTCTLSLKGIEFDPASIRKLTLSTERAGQVLHSPLNYADNVQLNDLIAIQASSVFIPQPITPASFSLLKNKEIEVPLSPCKKDDVIILRPHYPLALATKYTVVINSNSEGSIERYSWSFTTTSGVKPPLLNLWEINMLESGRKWGEYLLDYNPKPLSYSESRGIYYDAQRVYFQIAAYTGEKEPWETYAAKAEKIYRVYLDSRNWVTQGWRKFPHGFYLDWVRNADKADKDALLALRDNKVFHNPDTFTNVHKWYWSDLSREIAYAIEANVYAERAGHARNNTRVQLYVDMALNHINEWITGERGNPDVTKHRFAPFMAGLTAEALIDFYEWEVAQGHNPDDKIPSALMALADFLWESKVVEGVNQGKPMWVSDIGGTGYPHNDLGGTGYGAFRYEDRQNPASALDGTTVLSPELNMLIAPLYAWLYKYYGDSIYIKRGDLIWEGGVALSNVGWNTKIFNQNYRWSFDYVEWRKDGNMK